MYEEVSGGVPSCRTVGWYSRISKKDAMNTRERETERKERKIQTYTNHWCNWHTHTHTSNQVWKAPQVLVQFDRLSHSSHFRLSLEQSQPSSLHWCLPFQFWLHPFFADAGGRRETARSPAGHAFQMATWSAKGIQWACRQRAVEGEHVEPHTRPVSDWHICKFGWF